ncbi:uncharacterized protein LOC143127076 [Alosa pseudoharengus]|uniref:uncharacterized protein LOC143127076 n=1 Tax=Alosa pseudoharengus TaxID=34774 RepID=UPI003F8889CA
MSILKTRAQRLEKDGGAQSNSFGGVRWRGLDEDLKAHSSVPSMPLKKQDSSIQSSLQIKHRQQGLRDLRSLQECIRFLNHWKDQVAQVCKKGDKAKEDTLENKMDSRTVRSLEESRKLILEWANELNSVDMLSKDSPWMRKQMEDLKLAEEEEGKEEKENKSKQNELLEQKLMEWAQDLKITSEKCGMLGDELGQALRLLGLRKKRLVSLMPLLEFITWSLLKEDCTGMPQLWLSAKQRKWEGGTRRFIPNSVWSWIISAASNVSLDPMTNHPWLLVSDDQKKVMESHTEADLPYSPQRYDGWPCVLGWEGFMSGRHYWEVELANEGYWRVGVTTGCSKRHGRFPMNPGSSYWTLWRSTRQFYACTKPETPLAMSLVPRRLGVYLDYEEGQISFYNAENRSHIYTFKGHFREKLYPLFAPLDGRTLITIKEPSSSVTSL